MRHRRKRAGLLKSALLGAATIGALSLAGAGVAQADLVSVGAQIDSGSITTIVDQSSGANLVSYGATDSYGQISGKVYASSLIPEPDLSSTNFTIDNTSGVSGSVTIYITEQGVSSPTGPFSINSGFTGNLTSGDVTGITESTYVDFTNGLYLNGSPKQLATATFKPPYPNTGSLPTASDLTAVNPTATPFSLTEVYTVGFGGKGRTNLTIDLQRANATNAPEPGSLALLGTGVLGLGLVARRRRRKA